MLSKFVTWIKGLQSLDFTVNRFFMKLFRKSNIINFIHRKVEKEK